MKVAALQMVSGPSLAANLADAGRLIAMAADRGAGLVALPENFALMAMCGADTVRTGESEGFGPIQDFLGQQASRHGLWLVGGTIPLTTLDSNRVRSACLVFDPDGKRVARYDKMHLFDASVADQHGDYAESNTFEAGSSPMVCDTPFGRLGLSICYDLRFPELYRRLGDMGAEIFLVPSAFTAVTGQAHWEILLRARAIENLCYVVAPAQGGLHAGGRETHGDSMIVDPWGVIQGRRPRDPGVVLGSIDREAMSRRRKAFPCLQHRRSDLPVNSPHNETCS